MAVGRENRERLYKRCSVLPGSDERKSLDVGVLFGVAQNNQLDFCRDTIKRDTALWRIVIDDVVDGKTGLFFSF
jgi:hypothetical protein